MTANLFHSSSPDALEIAGHLGRPIPNQYRRAAGNLGHLAFVLPGLGYRASMPLLYYLARLLTSRGADVLTLDYAWDLQPGFLDAADRDQLSWMTADVEAAFFAGQRAADYRRITIIAKSIGCLALASTLQRPNSLREAGIIWLTPPFKISDFRRLFARCEQRACLVTGTADDHYDPIEVSAAATRAIETVILPGLDHSLEKPGDPMSSIAALAEIIARLDSWLR